MKILLLWIIVLTGNIATAQCTPDPQYTSPGFYPDSATGFVSATANAPYEQLITIVVPVDTTVFIGPLPVTLTFDSLVVVNVIGLPPGLSYSCFDGQNVSSPVDQCAFEGGTTGCISIVGVPELIDEGIYNLSIEVNEFIEGAVASNSIDYYSINIYHGDIFPPPPIGIEEYNKSRFKLFPNPVAESFTMDGLEGLDISSISISNAEGKVVNSFTDIHSPSFELNVTGLEGGIYFVRIAHETSIDVVRFIKE